MSYCVLSDIEGLNASRNNRDTPAYQYGVGTHPTATQVLGFIAQIAGEIDTALSRRYVLTPVTQPASFVAFLLHLNALGAASLAEAAQFPEFDTGTPGFTPQAKRWYTEYEAGLKGLQDGSAIDPNAPLSGTATLARTYLTDNPLNDPFQDGTVGDDAGQGQQPIFSMSRRLVDF